MRNRDRLDPERADLEGLARLVDRHRDVRRVEFRQALRLKQSGCEGRHPDLRLQPRPQFVQRTVMVLMRMRDDDAAQIAEVLFDEPDVRHDQIDAGMLVVRERHADINDDPLAPAGRPIAVEREVHADFAKSAQRHEYKFGSVCHENSCCAALAPGKFAFFPPKDAAASMLVREEKSKLSPVRPCPNSLLPKRPRRSARRPLKSSTAARRLA